MTKDIYNTGYVNVYMYIYIYIYIYIKDNTSKNSYYITTQPLPALRIGRSVDTQTDVNYFQINLKNKNIHILIYMLFVAVAAVLSYCSTNIKGNNALMCLNLPQNKATMDATDI